MKQNSKRTYYLYYKCFFDWAVEKKYFPSSPFHGVKLESTLSDVKNPSVMTIVETVLLFHFMHKDYWSELALLCFSGLRKNDLLKTCLHDENPRAKEILMLRDIDFKNRKITVRAAVAKKRREHIYAELTSKSLGVHRAFTRQTKKIS